MDIPEGERKVMARSSPLAFERSTLRESDSLHGAKKVHLAFAGEGGGRTEGVRAANAAHPTLPAHEKTTCRGQTSARGKPKRKSGSLVEQTSQGTNLLQ